MLRIIAIGDPHFKVKNVIQIDIFIEKLLALVKEKKTRFYSDIRRLITPP